MFEFPGKVWRDDQTELVFHRLRDQEIPASFLLFLQSPSKKDSPYENSHCRRDSCNLKQTYLEIIIIFYFQVVQTLLSETHSETEFRRMNKITLAFPPHPHSLRISAPFQGTLLSQLCGDLDTSSVLKAHSYFHMKVHKALLKRSEVYAGIPFWRIQSKENKTATKSMRFFYTLKFHYTSLSKTLVYFYGCHFQRKFSTYGTKMTFKNTTQNHLLQMEFCARSSLKSECFSPYLC